MIRLNKQAAVLGSREALEKLGKLLQAEGIAYTYRASSPGGVMEEETKKPRTHMGSLQHKNVYYVFVGKEDFSRAIEIWEKSGIV